MNTSNFELIQQIANDQHQMLLAEARREQWVSGSKSAPSAFWRKLWRGATWLAMYFLIM